MINRTALLSTLKPAVTSLEVSITQRADEVPEIAEHLALEHEKAVAAERTAMSLDESRGGEITQAAVAWVLGCVFVRFLEDNRLIDQPLIAGSGARGAAALGHRSEYFQREPGHSDREYLEACFREVAAFPAVAALYDERHNPLWRLGPTADGAGALRETFTAIDSDTGDLLHDFTDPDLGTRFLGDLYQDLSDAAKKRYALLQTPDFVERFILDRTLTPALAEFGLDDVRLIDPTCGSGHFLIGAFERLFALWQQREPGTTETVLAQRCLDQIAGVDLNDAGRRVGRLGRAATGPCPRRPDQRATRSGRADAERVTTLLAGVLELLPWIHQWHPDSDPLFAGPPGAFFESWLDGQLAELAITRETLRAWRPPAPTRGRRARASSR